MQALLKLPAEELKTKGVFKTMRRSLGKMTDWFGSSSGPQYGLHGPLPPPFGHLKLNPEKKPDPTDGENNKGDDVDENDENDEGENNEEVPNGEQTDEVLRLEKRKLNHGPHLTWHQQLAVQG